MSDFGHDLMFGCFLTPDAAQPEAVVEIARLADELGLELLGVQDHPYQPRFLDMWTLLSTLATETTRIRLVPDVVNLPLRPPAVLARAAASLDILSGGRVELGLGAGAFGDAAAAMGGARRSPKQATDALAEAIAVIRALWTRGPVVSFDGEHYQLAGAQPGPFPVHPIEIWVGAYKPRMLELTGRLADGWIPSAAYAPPTELAAMTRTLDAAAADAGRDPGTIRRVYNVNGTFSSVERGFLNGPPHLWVEQLSELVLTLGVSAFVLAPGRDAASDLRRFVEDVAPAVRETVERARQHPEAGRKIEEAPADTVVMVQPPPSAAGVPRSSALDEDARPHLPKDPDAIVTPTGRAGQQTLIQIHQHLRQELAEIRDAAAAVAQGRMDPAAARSLMNRMTMRQNYWSLGAFCAQYCRVVNLHHTIEDQHMFPGLQRAEESLSPVLDRLGWEHEIIAEQLDKFDQALVAMINDASKIEDVRRIADVVNEMLLSHLAYEEDELLRPIGRLSIAI